MDSSNLINYLTNISWSFIMVVPFSRFYIQGHKVRMKSHVNQGADHVLKPVFFFFLFPINFVLSNIWQKIPKK